MEKEVSLKLDTVHIPRWNELPNVELYMDQIVTFINTSLEQAFKLNYIEKKKDNPILTKTMINNYVKNNLIESPIKKKYSKSQCAKLFAICILKQVYSMNEISNLINIALSDSEISYAYDSFCSKFEQTLKCAFHQEDISKIKTDSENNYLLKSVLLSCSYKIYVQNAIS